MSISVDESPTVDIGPQCTEKNMTNKNSLKVNNISNVKKRFRRKNKTFKMLKNSSLHVLGKHVHFSNFKTFSMKFAGN